MTSTALDQTASSEQYDAFISYRTGQSSKAAEYVNTALHNLGRRHQAGRPMRIFLDKSSLATGGLTRNIEDALLRSKNLIVLLDETTHESPWVSLEIARWLEGGGNPEHLYLVRTSPELDLSWNEVGFVHPDRLPAPLRSAFAVEQKWVDVPRDIRNLDDRVLAGLYAAIMVIEPVELQLEEARYQQRQRKRNRMIVSGLSGLLVIALATGGLALTSWRAASASGLQSQADADAAQSILTLPVSRSDAAGLVTRAAAASQSTSVRAAMLAVASGLGLLRRVVDFGEATQGATLEGLSFDARGARLLTWGRPASGSGTAIAVWDVASGDALNSFTVPMDNLSRLVEIPRHAFLGCSPSGPIRIDWTRHDISRLGGSSVWDDEEGRCTTGLIATAGTVEYGVGDHPFDLYVETIAGVTATEQGVGLSSGSSTRSFGVVDSFTDGAADFILSAKGLVAAPAAAHGEVLNQQDNAVFVRSGSSARALTLTGDTLAVTNLGDYPDAAGIVGLRDYRGRLSVAWIDRFGTVWFSKGGSIALSDPETTGSPASGKRRFGPSIFNLGGDIYATLGSSVWMVTPPSTTSSSGSAKLVLGSLGESPIGGSPLVDSCGDVVLFSDSQFLHGSVLGDSAGGEIVNCHLLTLSPLSIDGLKKAGIAAPEDSLRSVAPDGGLAVGDADGVIQIISAGSDELVPWRVYPSTNLIRIAGGGTRILTTRGDTLTISGPDGVQTLSPGEEARWLGARPDGLGGFYVASRTVYAGTGKEKYRALDSRCNNTTLFYRPDSDFGISVEAAERQLLAPVAEPTLDCLTGEEVGEIPDVEEYVVGPTGGHLIWRTDDRSLRITTWRRGDAAPLTLELPQGVGRQAVLGLDEMATSLLVGLENSRRVDEYRREGDAWTYLQSYSVTTDSVAALRHNPDSSLMVAVSSHGAFDLFDVSSGRLLASERNDLLDREYLQSLFVLESDGLMYLHMLTWEDDQVTEVPVGVSQLKEVICGVYKSTSC